MTTVPNDCLDWPGVSQGFRLTRARKAKGVATTEVVFGITSLSRKQSDVEAMIGYVRSHLGIENRLHHVRDVTFGEDKCRVRSGSSPHILEAIRNLTIPLLREIEPKNIPAAMRRLAAKPRWAIPNGRLIRRMKWQWRTWGQDGKDPLQSYYQVPSSFGELHRIGAQSAWSQATLRTAVDMKRTALSPYEIEAISLRGNGEFVEMHKMPRTKRSRRPNMDRCFRTGFDLESCDRHRRLAHEVLRTRIVSFP